MRQAMRSPQELLAEMEDLKRRVELAEDTLEAIRTGAVDAVAIQGSDGTKIYTLEGADETYRTLVENMSESAVTLNNEGIILYANARFARLINVPLSRVIGHPFKLFIPEDLYPEYKEMLAAGWHRTIRREFMVCPKNKPLVHTLISINAISNKGGTVLGILLTDLSARKELEKLSEAKKELHSMNEELSEKNKQLTRTNFDLDNFIYTASHDLKAPISNIEGLVITLKSILEDDDLLREDVVTIISMMSHSVNRFKKTIHDLTEISKTQKDEVEDLTLLSCTDIIDDVKETLKSVIDSKAAQIEIDTSKCSEIYFSRKNLKSIVYNLLSNAIKYCAPDRLPKVNIQLDYSEEYAILSVTDNGLGIKNEDIPKVFNMFKRLHDHVEGTGIGLYIVKRIVDNAGGKIEVESVLGKGTTFRVYFRR